MTSSSELTYAGVLLAVFAQQLGLPIPSVVFLMTAGALAAHGRMQTSIVVFLGILGCLAADWLWFWFGRRWGARAVWLLCRFTADPRKSARNAHEKFRRQGLGILCVAKFLPGLDGILPPLAGAEGVSLGRFLALDSVGSGLWSSSCVALGYLFSDELNIAISLAQHSATVLGIAIGAPIAVYALWRGLTMFRVVRQLRQRRISPTLLAGELKSNSKVALLDLLNFEEEADTDSADAIPGAFRVDPTLLRESPQITVPDDAKIVLYSPSGSDTVSARAAVGLKRIGVDGVWMLEGGLKAWREHGFPVSQSLEPPEVIAERLGVKRPASRLGSDGKGR